MDRAQHLAIGRFTCVLWCVRQSRQKLEHVNTLQDVADLLRAAKKVVILAGAGISVSCGIPDFRSENGIYSVRDCYASSDAIGGSIDARADELVWLVPHSMMF